MAHIGKSLEVLKRDKRFARLVKKYGKPTFSRCSPTASGVFQALLRSIIYQQLSGKAAASIHARFVALYPRKRPTPVRVLTTPGRTLRTCGLSEAKVGYMKDIARKFANRMVNYRAFPDM